MKNCPWFSLRSNSIESRFRSIRRGNFWVNISVTLRKAKARSKAARNSLRSWAFLLTSLGLGSQFGKFAPMRDTLPCRWWMDRELVIRERKGRIFFSSLVDTRSVYRLMPRDFILGACCCALSCCSCLSFICCSALISSTHFLMTW